MTTQSSAAIVKWKQRERNAEPAAEFRRPVQKSAPVSLNAPATCGMQIPANGEPRSGR